MSRARAAGGRRLAASVILLALCSCAGDAARSSVDAAPRAASRLVGDERRSAISPRRAGDAVRVEIPSGAGVRIHAAAWRSGWRGLLAGGEVECAALVQPGGRVERFRVPSPRDEDDARWVTLPDVTGTESVELSCDQAPDSGEAWFAVETAPAPAPGARSILLVSLDAVRLDAVGRADPRATPVLDAFAGEAAAFTRAFAPAPWTLPSHVSVMTGLMPSWHGRWDAKTRDRELPPVTTLASVLGGAGWDTAAFTGMGSISWTLGATRDFRLVVEHEATASAAATKECDVSAERVVAWLRARAPGDRPFLLFWHTYEAHAPYHDERFAGSSSPLPPGVAEDAREDWLRYLGDLAAADAALGRILATLDETGLAPTTDVVLFSDHGEEFGEHSEGRREDATRHGHGLWDTLLRVPLVIRSPAMPRGERADLASLVDLFPTVLELAGLEPPPSQGRSLADERGSGRAAIAAESLYLPHAEHEQKCWREADLKHVSVLSSPPREIVWDLARDPLEMGAVPVDLSEFATESARMREEAAAFWREAPMPTAVRIGRPEGAEVPPELLESLRALGYVR